jgi:Pyruvate/2-oxoacid:ferredoxin oxidoreductase gamma subunit
LAQADVSTHYCPGCTHGLIHRLVAEVIDELGVRERTVGIAPVGCAVLAYKYFNTDFHEASHGRAPAVATGIKPAVATGIKRARPDLIVFSYQGDGDLASIGMAEIVHCANRGEKVTVVFVNNAIYGMTGGEGRGSCGPPDPRRRAHLDPAHTGLCRSRHGSQPVGGGARQGDAAPRLHDQLGHPAGRVDQLAGEEHAALLSGRGLQNSRWRQPRTATADGLREESMQSDVVMAGFGGQGILLIGKMLAYAGMHDGKEVSWLPSYGPEMRGGTCNCTVVISDTPVGSPVIRSPRAVLAMNLPSLEKFEPDIRMATELGNPRGANMVALGAYLGATDAVSLEEIENVIRETFAAKPGVIEVNIEALHKGYELGAAAKDTMAEA